MAEYIVVMPQIVGGDGKPFTTVYCSDLERFQYRRSAILHGLRERGSDDFLIVTLQGDAVVNVGWMRKDRSDPEEIADVALHLCLKTPRKVEGG